MRDRETMPRIFSAMRVQLIRAGALIERYRRDKRANIAIMFGLLAPALIASLGLGMESANWYQTQRNLQNAADEAAVAAATNASATYSTEALATTAQYGYTDGTNNVTVTTSNTAACPSGGNNCYSVTVSQKVQLYLMPVIGYQGNTTLNGSPAVTISATAIAKQGTQPRQYCLLSLSTIGTGIIGNGVPNANLAGCNIMSDSAANCNGHDTGANIGDARLSNSGCGVIQNSNMPSVPDPYSGLASNIPANNCASYPQEPAHHNDPALPNSNKLSGSYTWSGTVEYCGDVQLTGDVTINATSGAVLVIENGQLDTNGHTFQTASTSYLTIIFSGTTNGSYTHAPTGGGTLSYQAPTSGTWSGVALYQDPSLTSGVDISSAGNSPTWNITGLVYLPKSNVTFNGAVNKFNNGASCFVMVVYTVDISGTGAILEHDGCPQAGLTMPASSVPGAGTLVT